MWVGMCWHADLVDVGGWVWMRVCAILVCLCTLYITRRCGSSGRHTSDCSLGSNAPSNIPTYDALDVCVGAGCERKCLGFACVCVFACAFSSLYERVTVLSVRVSRAPMRV